MPKIKKVQLFCHKCGSKNVRKDASVAWDETLQDWTIISVYDNATCEDCGAEGNCVIEEVGVKNCKKCGTRLNKQGRCKDKTCPYSDRSQETPFTEG